MSKVFSNSAQSTLSFAVLAGDAYISLQAGDGVLFNDPASGEQQQVVLEGASGKEIAAITNVVGDDLYITRAQEGTTALAFVIGDSVFAGLTAEVAERFVQSEPAINPLGTSALNIQPLRYDEANIASGSASVAVGINTQATHSSSVALGTNAASTGSGGIAAGQGTKADVSAAALGPYSEATGHSSVAIGSTAKATNINSIAIGRMALADVPYVHNIAGSSLVRGDKGENASFVQDFFSGQENYIFSQDVDMTGAPSDGIAFITIPSGARMFPVEVGVVVIESTGASVLPTISAGTEGYYSADTEKILATVATTGSVPGKVDKFTALANTDGVFSLIAFSLKSSAVADTMVCRFYVKGLMLEGGFYDTATGTGFSRGGYDTGGTTYRNLTAGMTFLTDTMLIINENLSANKGGGAGASSSLKGYYMGGQLPAVTAVIEDLIFSTITTGIVTDTLSVARRNPAGVSSSLKGYAMAGFSTVYESIVDGILFSNDSAVTTSVSLTARDSCGSNYSALKGYAYGGTTGSYSLEIDGLLFSNDSTINPASALSVARKSAAGVQSGTKGYVLGGLGASYSDLIESLLHADESVAVVSDTLPSVKSGASSVSSEVKGYAFTGVDSNGTSTGEVTGIRFFDETAINPNILFGYDGRDAVGMQG